MEGQNGRAIKGDGQVGEGRAGIRRVDNEDNGPVAPGEQMRPDIKRFLQYPGFLNRLYGRRKSENLQPNKYK